MSRESLKANSPQIVMYACAAWLSMSLTGYGLAIRKYAATHEVHADQLLLASSGGDFIIAGLLLVPALALIHVGIRRLRISPASSSSVR